jgi:bacterioferritin-associated ferredoxin
MILCVCRGVSEHEVIEAIQRGARDLRDVSERCDGAGTDCGSCQAYIAFHLSDGCPRRSAAA